MTTIRKVIRSTGNGQAPGIDQNAISMKALQDYNNAQVYTKGFRFTTQAGVNNPFNIQLGGKCRKIHGVIFFVPTANVNDDDIISLTINQELVIDNVNWKAYSPATSGNTFKPNQFYELRRALSGSDTVDLQVNSVNAHNVFPIFYLSNA